MHSLQRRIYGLLLRLHPAEFRDEFAREMALDFEDALFTFGLSRLLMDAASSLARQWSAGIFSGAPAPVSALRPSLLTGKYVVVCDRSFTALELGFGLMAAAAEVALCLLAINASPGYRPGLVAVYASSSTPARHGGGNQETPLPAGGSSGFGFKPSQSNGASLGVARKAEDGRASWEKAAGGTMAFEVASVRGDKGEFKPPSFALSADEWFRDPKGRFHADFELPVYIEFAYKIWLAPEEQRAMLAKLPEWVKTDRFAIEAVAPLNTTKDQYRLMMQTLLADRFGLKLHFEQRDLPVLAMVLVKPPKPGPRLIPHAQGQACEEKPKAETFPSECYSFAAMPGKDGMWLSGSRATSMDLIGNFIGSLAGSSGEIGRPVVNQTGLTGLWDYTLEAAAPSQTLSDPQRSTGPTMLEAVQDQLGIKLKPMRAIVSVPVIDHVEQPSPN